MKPKILLLPEEHHDVEVHKRQAEEVLKFKPEVCLLEMYDDPADYKICANFSRTSLEDLRKGWHWHVAFDVYLPLIEAIRKIRAEARPLTPNVLVTGEIDEEKDPIGNLAMKEIICKYSGGFSRVAAVCGYCHVLGSKGAKAEGLKYLLEDSFAVVFPQYAKGDAEFGKFMVL